MVGASIFTWPRCSRIRMAPPAASHWGALLGLNLHLADGHGLPGGRRQLPARVASVVAKECRLSVGIAYHRFRGGVGPIPTSAILPDHVLSRGAKPYTSANLKSRS